MKKIYSIILIVLLCSITLNCTGQEEENLKSNLNEWTGLIRIEGKEESVWHGSITVSDTFFDAKNVDTGEISEYYISYPSVLGAITEAADISGFSYIIEYWPGWDTFLLKTIDDNSDWWHYWVDYEIPMIGAKEYELTENNNEILWGYLENWTAKALKISIDKNEVKKDEEFTVSVFDLEDNPISEANVIIGSNSYITNNEGTATIKISDKGTYEIHAEKDDYVRSEKESVQVKKKSRVQLLEIISYFYNFKEKFSFTNYFLISKY